MLARRVASGLLGRVARTADAIADRIDPQGPIGELLAVLGGSAPNEGPGVGGSSSAAGPVIDVTQSARPGPATTLVPSADRAEPTAEHTESTTRSAERSERSRSSTPAPPGRRAEQVRSQTLPRQPTTSESTTSESTTSKPTTSKPTTSEPTTSESTTSKPTISKPTTRQPAPHAPRTPVATSAPDASHLQTRPSESPRGQASETAGEPLAPRSADATAEPTASPALTPSAYPFVEHLASRVTPRLSVLRASAPYGPDTPPDDPDALRELRVASRRLRAFVTLFAPIIGHKDASKLNRRLRKITRAIGPVRDIQAHVSLIERAMDTAPGDLQRAALEHLRVQVEHALPETTATALRAVAKAKPAAIATDIDALLDRLYGRLLRAGDGVSDLLWPAVHDRMETFLGTLPSRDPHGDLETLHEVRIRAKRLRYSLELVRPLLGAEDRGTRRIAKKLQRTLGDLHDAALLDAITREHATTLAEQGHAILAHAVRHSAEALASAQAHARQAATPWLAAFTPESLVPRLAHAFSKPTPAWAQPAESNPSPASDGSGQP